MDLRMSFGVFEREDRERERVEEGVWRLEKGKEKCL
jgi:hypothetical protein